MERVAIINKASRLQRFFNYLIDLFIGCLPFYFIIRPYVVRAELNPVYGLMIIYMGYILYCVILESIFNTTVGKLVSKTKIVMLNNVQIPLTKIIIRNVSRMIPFNSIVTFFTKYSFHENISKVYTVMK